MFRNCRIMLVCVACVPYTTGLRSFAVCLRHTAKWPKHTAKVLP